jgi:hypothetical protein
MQHFRSNKCSIFVLAITAILALTNTVALENYAEFLNVDYLGKFAKVKK